MEGEGEEVSEETRYFRVRLPRGVAANLHEGHLLLAWKPSRTIALVRCLLAAAAKVVKVTR